MKRVILFLLVFLLPSLAAGGQKNPWDIKLPFKKATIEYAISGMENGSETLYVRDHGRQTARYHKTTMKMMGMTKVTDTVEFMDPDWVYTFDLQEQTATKAVNPQKYMIEEYNKLSKEEQKKVMENSQKMTTASTYGGVSAEIEKNAAKILGYDCDRVKVMGMTMYSLHDVGLPMKTESNMMGMKMLMEAVSVDEGSAPKKFFEHPQGITPVLDPESEAMARSMAQETIAMLKDPEAARQNSGNRPMMQGGGQQDMTPEEQQQMEQAMEALKNIFGN